MNKPMDQQSISERVRERIQSGTVPMHSRAFFLLRVIALSFFSFVIALLALLALSLVLFSVHESGELFLLGFGFQGVLTFFALFPWSLVIAVGLLLFALQWFLLRFTKAYRVPLLKLYGALILLSSALGLFLALSPLHPAIRSYSKDNDFPFLGQLYEDIYAPHEEQGVFRGTVIEVKDGRQVHIIHNDIDRDEDDMGRLVTLPDSFGEGMISVGDELFVAGSAEEDGHVRAYGVQIFPRK